MKKKPIFETPEELQLSKDLVRSVLPYLIYHLLEDGILKEEDLSNKGVVIQKIRENSTRIIEKMKVQIVGHRGFLDSCKSEFENGRPESGVIMASVCIENMINLFYREMLEVMHSLDTGTINSIIKMINIPDKLGWFLKIAFNLELSKDLVNQVKELNSLRNKIVHFNAIPNDGFDAENGSYSKIQKDVKPYTVEQLEMLINNLETEFEKVKLNAVPSYRLAFETIEKEFNFDE